MPETFLVVSRSRLQELMLPDEIASLPQMLTGNLPPGWKVHKREFSVEFTCQIDGEMHTIGFRKNGPLAERMMAKLGMDLLDATDYRQAYWEHREQVKQFARQLDVALNGEAGAAPNPSLVDIVAQATSEAKKRFGPILEK